MLESSESSLIFIFRSRQVFTRTAPRNTYSSVYRDSWRWKHPRLLITATDFDKMICASIKRCSLRRGFLNSSAFFLSVNKHENVCSGNIQSRVPPSRGPHNPCRDAAVSSVRCPYLHFFLLLKSTQDRAARRCNREGDTCGVVRKRFAWVPGS